MEHVAAGLVTFTARYSSPSWTGDQISSSTLRFLDVEVLDEFLAQAGLAITARFGSWDLCPCTHDQEEIITIASAA